MVTNVLVEFVLIHAQPRKTVSLLIVLLIMSMLVRYVLPLIFVKLFDSSRAAWSMFTAASVSDTQLRDDLIIQVWNRIAADLGPFGLNYTTNLVNTSYVVSR